MTTIIVTAVLGTAIAFLLFFIIKSIAAPKKIEGIQKLTEQGKYSAAIKLAKMIIAKNPRDYFAHYYLGQAYLEDNKPELALMEFKVVNQNAIFENGLPEVDFRKKIASLYKKFNQNDEALKEYLLLTKLEPVNADHYYNAGCIFELKGKADQALFYYQQAIKYNKRFCKAHASLGLIFYRLKQFPDAKREIDIAIQLNPEIYSSYFYLGKILKENKDYAAAVTAFEKSLRDPEFKQKALIECGSCYMAVNNIEKAISEFDRAVKAAQNESSQETLYARYFLAACYERVRKIETAIIQWKAIHNINKNFKDVTAKLSQYQDIEANDNMKEYLTCNSDNFYTICKKIALTGFGLAEKTISTIKSGCTIIATEAKADWKNIRQQQYILQFFRDPDLIEDTVIRKLLEEIKNKGYSKGIICTSSGFTHAAINFAENRPIELVPKDKLEIILSRIED